MTNPAYMIIGVNIHDADSFRRYAQGAMPLLSRSGATILSGADDVTGLRGDWVPDRLVVLKFGSMKDARGFWNAPYYAPFKALRESCSDADILLVDEADEYRATGPDSGGSPHYLLGFSDMVNTDWAEEYSAGTTPIAARYGLTAVCRSDQFEVLDGSFDRRSMILLEFPSKAAFEGFWNDPDYAPLKKLREDNTEGEQVAFAAGFSPV